MTISSEQQLRKFLTYPIVIDWLQWSDEFKESPNEPSNAQIALSLIAEYRLEYKKLEEELQNSRDAFKILEEQAFKFRNQRDDMRLELEEFRAKADFFKVCAKLNAKERDGLYQAIEKVIKECWTPPHINIDRIFDILQEAAETYRKQKKNWDMEP